MKIENKITTVLFDLDGTLRHSVPNGFDLILKYANNLGLEADPDRRRKIGQWTHRYWANSECLLNDKKTFNSENGDFWQNYAKRQFEAFGVTSEQAQAWAPDAHVYMEKNFKPEDNIPEDVYETLQKLKDVNYCLGLVTNRSNPIDEYISEVGLKKYFDFYFTAGEIDSWKPNAKIFQHALNLAQAEAHEAIYVGDNYYADVVGARNANILPVLLDPNEIFPEADCPVIQKIGDLPKLLNGKLV